MRAARDGAARQRVRRAASTRPSFTASLRVKDPLRVGAGTAAFRDVQCSCRYASADVSDTQPRGRRRQVGDHARFFAVGQLHSALHPPGMNQDEEGRIVHEGAWPMIAGRRVANNSRWGQPDGVLELYQMGSEGPQWWSKYPDDVRDLPDGGILDRCKRTKTCPKVVETFGGAEVFALKMTMSWVGTSAKEDIPLPRNVQVLPSQVVTRRREMATTENPAAPPRGCPATTGARAR